VQWDKTNIDFSWQTAGHSLLVHKRNEEMLELKMDSIKEKLSLLDHK
jgi:hypothetical protein